MNSRQFNLLKYLHNADKKERKKGWGGGFKKSVPQRLERFFSQRSEKSSLFWWESKEKAKLSMVSQITFTKSDMSFWVPLTGINMKLVIWPLVGGMHEQLHQLAHTLKK